MTATHPEAAAFEARIAASADDDLPRLVYADWLEENGQGERAAFVRVQCELAKLEPVLATRYEDQDLCTEGSANWCPVCGDCCCPSPEDEKCDSACPLHAPTSRHGGDDSLKAVIGALRRRERELWSDGGVGKFFATLPGMPIDYFVLPWEKVDDLPGSVCVVARGFPEAVTLPTAAALTGGLCDHCGGGRPGLWMIAVDAAGRCRTCKGEGRTPGLAATLGRLMGWQRCGAGCARHLAGDGDEAFYVAASEAGGVTRCPACSGTGSVRVPGRPLGTVRRVGLADREPSLSTPGWRWFNNDPSGSSSAARIGAALYALLPGYPQWGSPQPHWDTPGAARDALGVAGAEFCRRAAAGRG